MELMPIDRDIVAEFGGYKHKGRITAATFNAEKGLGEYTIKINLRKSIQEEKQAMTNTQFKIGDDIIMTADSEKGLLFVGYKNGDTRNGLIKHVHDDGGVSIVLADDTVFSFESNGIGSGYPGMSIRPAKEKVEPTPSQWIEGQIPQNKPGLYAIWTVNNQSHIIKAFADGGGSMLTYQCWQNYTYYIPILNLLSNILPPPPPAKEVEVLGYLEFCNKYVEDWQDYSQGGVDKADKARAFYSQPATAENLNKYFISESRERWGNCDADITLDQFVAWFKKSIPLTLYFTPAALDKLGVK